VLGLIQFMLVLDMTVVNVALPRIQHDLGFTHPGLAWVVNGYVLMAGGLLLLGGRLADVYGRRRMFLAGVSVFAAASATSGAAATPAMLVASRFMQGAGEALAAPAALGLIAVLFTDPNERMKAVGVWGGIAGLGGVSGTVISGALTGLASWRWIFFINLPVALIALMLVPRLAPESRMARGRRRIDAAGAVTSAAGLVGIVYGLLQAASHPWSARQVLVPLGGGVALLAIMALVKAQSAAPLIPLRFFANRTRVTANLAGLVFSAAFFTYLFLLTLFEQQVLGYSPFTGGLSYLPFGAALGAGMGLGTALMPRVGVKPVLSAAFFGAAAGLLLSSGIAPGASYARGILPGMIVLGASARLSFPAILNAALHQVTGQDSSLASGVQSAMQQVGGALGLACLVTLAVRHAVAQVHRGVPAAVAATQGYVLVFRIDVVLLAVGGALALALLEHVTAQPRNPAAELSPDPRPLRTPQPPRPGSRLLDQRAAGPTNRSAQQETAMSAQSPDLSISADTLPGRRGDLTASPSQAVPATDSPAGERLPLSATERTRHRRFRALGRTDQDSLYAVLEAGLVAHLGVITGGWPMAVPTCYGFTADTLYLHGSVASQSLNTPPAPRCASP
jgi:EmrB/QacA subfamily drug resistance transporter